MGKIVLWLQERIKHWTKPASSALIIGILSDLTRSHTELVVENALLRQQLIVLKRQIKRPQLTNLDRFRMVFLSHFTAFWKQALHIVHRILCYDGIENFLACIGGRNRKASQRLLLKRLRR